MKCFTIMPFGNIQINAERAAKLESIYSRWIKPAVESITVPGTQNEKITCHRGDRTFRPGEVITHIIENLISAEIVIADLSGKNANVFYEVGVRHSVGNNCILISDDIDDVPFDLRSLRTIIYKYEPDSMLMLQDALKQAIQEILQNINVIDNPVRRFINQMEVDKISQKQSSLDSDVIKNVISEISSLRNEFTEQSVEIRRIMKLITATPDNTLVSPKLEMDLKSLEGVWSDKESDSKFYFRLTNGELGIPYSYGGLQRLMGHVYNYKLIDKTLFGRFEWFDNPISGYIFFRIESNDEITGGWWSKEDLPEDILKNISKVNDTLPRMNKLMLKRTHTSTTFPAYIETYFSRA